MARLTNLLEIAMWVIGNFKQNPVELVVAEALATQALQASHGQNVSVAIAPSFVHLASVGRILCNADIGKVTLAAQDVHDLSATFGAYTGDVSAAQVAALGATMTLIGHSERRQYHGENNAILSAKLANACQAGLQVVFCAGENKLENASGQTLSVIDAQLAPLLALNTTANILVAYEPVWAIGTGMTPILADIERVHQYIKQKLPEVPVLYGGSVNADNAGEFASSALIDGVLVGGACLNADSFAEIIRLFSK